MNFLHAHDLKPDINASGPLRYQTYIQVLPGVGGEKVKVLISQ